MSLTSDEVCCKSCGSAWPAEKIWCNFAHIDPVDIPGDISEADSFGAIFGINHE